MSQAVPIAAAMPTDPKALQVRGPDGGVLRVWEWEGQGPPLLLLHGFAMSGRVWDPIARAFGGRRVLAPDARGHGDSERGPAALAGYEAGPVDLAAVADALGLERFALVGHSMGAFASIRFCAAQPGRVERLVLVDAGPDLPAPPRLRPRAAPRRRPPLAGFASEADYASALGVLYPRADAAALRELAHHWLRRRPDGRYEPKLDAGGPDAGEAASEEERAAGRREASVRLWSQLASIACPTLIVRAALSTVLSAPSARRMLGVLRRGRLVELDGVGHAVMLEAPDALATALAGFLAEA